jgi:acyl transferase domain-containing protein
MVCIAYLTFNRDMDPQQRLFLEVTSEALEDSGHLPSSDGHNRIGLCVGAAHDTWGPRKQSIFIQSICSI